MSPAAIAALELSDTLFPFPIDGLASGFWGDTERDLLRLDFFGDASFFPSKMSISVFLLVGTKILRSNRR